MWRGLAILVGEWGTSYLKASWLTCPLTQQPGLGQAVHSVVDVTVSTEAGLWWLWGSVSMAWELITPAASRWRGPAVSAGCVEGKAGCTCT